MLRHRLKRALSGYWWLVTLSQRVFHGKTVWTSASDDPEDELWRKQKLNRFYEENGAVKSCWMEECSSTHSSLVFWVLTYWFWITNQFPAETAAVNLTQWHKLISAAYWGELLKWTGSLAQLRMLLLPRCVSCVLDPQAQTGLMIYQAAHVRK